MERSVGLLHLIVQPLATRCSKHVLEVGARAKLRWPQAFIAALVATLAPLPTLATVVLQNPFTVSVLYDADPGDPAATDICFFIGIPLSVNINQTVNLDLAFTGPLGGSPVDIYSARQGGAADSTVAAHQICFYFPSTPVQPGETLNITMEGDGSSNDPPLNGNQMAVGDYWTFAQDLFEFSYPHLAPPDHGPVPFGIFDVIDRRGEFRPQDVHPFALRPPSNSVVTFDGHSYFTTTVPEPSTVWILSLAAACAALCSRRRREPGA
ncbi:PEP-CTERM sorting domain-containing protein [Roseateles cavernae]|uniref:PEP-CTERM sorting domain-containing protein n=1 Tax=Roseateles cavernae TaxID=3153578 RepID=UPI0032E3C435